VSTYYADSRRWIAIVHLAVVGIGLALGSKAAADVGLSFQEVGLFSGGIDIAVGALVLFLTNFAAIVVVAGTVMLIQGYAHLKQAILDLIGAILASIILMQPLSEGFNKLRVKSIALRLVKTLPVTHPHTFERSLRLDALCVRHNDDGILHIRTRGTMPRDKLKGFPARLQLFRQELEKQVGEPVIIDVDAVSVDIRHFRSAPDEGEDQETQFNPAIGERMLAALNMNMSFNGNSCRADVGR